MSDELKFEIVGKGTPHEDAAFLIQEQYKKFFFVPEPAFRDAVANGRLLGAFRGSKLVAYIWSTRKDGTFLRGQSHVWLIRVSTSVNDLGCDMPVRRPMHFVLNSLEERL